MKSKYVSPVIEVVLVQMEDDIVKSSVLPTNQNGAIGQEWEELDTDYRTIDLGDSQW
ncbi:hypothetical protein [Sphingobacterium corticibacter]|uniref:hypothetical protein n=1 Tax=Sphingobacterium corticibacter TaxID=2171749 RepID=UPI0013FDD97A|nr:hypothetical protein [Sphingobacterium corticibacter]